MKFGSFDIHCVPKSEILAILE